MEQEQLTYRDYALLVLIVAVAAIVFSPALQFTFTNWDDDIHITNNPAIQQLSSQSVIELFKPTEKYMYHPLTMLSYMIEWRFVGQRLDSSSGHARRGGQAWLFHLTNICLHLVNICLVFYLIVRISSDKFFSFFTAALFAFHPIQVESAAWISARKDVLSALFVLSSIVCYVRWKEKKTFWLYTVSLLLFICALLSKPSSVIVPLLLLLLSWFSGEKIGWRSLKDKIPFAVIAAVFTLFIVSTTTSNTIPPMQYYSLVQRVPMVFYELTFYVGKFILPINLSTCYSYPVVHNGSLPIEYYFLPLIIAAVAVAFFYYRKNIKPLLFGVLFYVAALLPVLQIIPFNNSSLVADRYAYLAIIGLSFSFSNLYELIANKIQFGLRPRNGKIILHLSSVFIVGMCIVLTMNRLPVWKDGVSLFTDVIKKNPNIPLAYGNRANAKIAIGDFEGAIEDCNKLLLFNFNKPKAYFNRGNAYSEMKKTREAITDYSTSIELGFQSPNVFYNRGNKYLTLNVFDSAAADFNTVLRLSPNYINALVQLEFIATNVEKNYGKSVFYLTEYQKYNPNDAWMYHQRARSNAKLNRFGAALSDAALAVSLNTNNDEVDDFFVFLDLTIDSINTKIKIFSEQLTKSPLNESIYDPVGSLRPNNRAKVYRARSELYFSLGDSLRAKNDVRSAQEVAGQRTW